MRAIWLTGDTSIKRTQLKTNVWFYPKNTFVDIYNAPLEVEIDTVEEISLFLSGGVGLCMSLLR